MMIRRIDHILFCHVVVGYDQYGIVTRKCADNLDGFTLSINEAILGAYPGSVRIIPSLLANWMETNPWLHSFQPAHVREYDADRATHRYILFHDQKFY